jgi:hypothetical protein
MRLYNKTFPLIAEFESSETGIQVYDHRFELLDTATAQFSLEIALPGRLAFRTDASARFVKMSLSGINFDRTSLLNIVEYKISKNTVTSWEQLDRLSTTRTLSWDQDGYLLLNLFHPNPFALHLFIGNKIKF